MNDLNNMSRALAPNVSFASVADLAVSSAVDYLMRA